MLCEACADDPACNAAFPNLRQLFFDVPVIDALTQSSKLCRYLLRPSCCLSDVSLHTILLGDEWYRMERAMQVKLKPAPILKMLGVVAVVTLIIVLIDAALGSLSNYETLMRDSSWLVADLVHVPQFLIPFLLIC